jgi:uncharacterized protein (TIGR00645 family)
MAPLFLGLIAALLLVVVQFFVDLCHAVGDFAGLSTSGVVVAVLKLVDLALLANLVLLMIVAGAEFYVPHRAPDDAHRPGLPVVANFAELKLKVFASISAIAAVDLLEDFINIDAMDTKAVVLQILILLTFVVAGLLLAWTDRLSQHRDWHRTGRQA